MSFGVIDCEGGKPGVQREPVCGSPAQLGGLGVSGGGGQGELVPELPELGLFGLDDDAVGYGVVYSPFAALLEGLVDGGAVAVGAAGDLG